MIDFSPPSQGASSQDERDYSTMKLVKREMEAFLYDLQHDFDAFAGVPAEQVTIEAAARKKAKELLLPLISTLNSSINSVENQINA